MSDDPLTLREAAEICGESVRTLRRRIEDGRLDAFQRGQATSPMLITRAALAAYMAQSGAARVAAIAALDLDVLESLIRRVVREELDRRSD